MLDAQHKKDNIVMEFKSVKWDTLDYAWEKLLVKYSKTN